MKHVQSNRVASAKVRPAKEKGHVALVVTASGLHSDVYVMTEAEAEDLYSGISEYFDGVDAPKKSAAKKATSKRK